MKRSKPLSIVSVALFSLLALVGCSRGSGVPRGTAEGKITVGGTPLTQGMVIFENSAAGVSVMVPLTSDGTYVVQTHEGTGLPVGVYQVAVSDRKLSNGEFPKVVQPGKDVLPPFPAPAKYRAVTTSGWTADIKEGKNPPFDFDAKK